MRVPPLAPVRLGKYATQPAHGIEHELLVVRAFERQAFTQRAVWILISAGRNLERARLGSHDHATLIHLERHGLRAAERGDAMLAGASLRGVLPVIERIG